MKYFYFTIIPLLLQPLYGISQHFTEIAKIVASDRDTLDEFSQSVDIDGNFVLVGSGYDSEDSQGNHTLPHAGAVYVFELINGNWTQIQKITASDRGLYDSFGSSVAVHGNYAVIGAGGDADSIGGGRILTGSGSAYIFERNANGLWTELQKIVAPDRHIIQGFGSSVDVWGNEIVIGSMEAKNASTISTIGGGAVYIYQRNISGTWTYTQKIDAPDADYLDYFGVSVSLYNNTLVVGAHGEDKNLINRNHLGGAGAAYIFSKQGSTWSLDQKIIGSPRNANDFFGSSVSVFGQTILVGAQRDDLDASGLNPINDAGAAYFYEKTGNTWVQTERVVASDRSASGFFGGWREGVALSANYAVIAAGGSPTDSLGNNPLPSAGASYIFKRQSSGWVEHQKIVSSDRQAGDSFGEFCAISNNTIIVSAREEDEDQNGLNTKGRAGSAYIFKPCITTFATIADTGCVSYTSPSGNHIWFASGTFQDTLKNVEGCDSILTINLIIQSASIPLKIDTVVYQSPTCHRGIDGKIQVNIKGGTLPYSLKWNTGDSLSLIENLDTGLYKIVVVDKFGCSDSAYFNLSEPDSISIGLVNLNNISCFGENDGELEVSISGGFPPYSISWNNGDSLQKLKNLSAGNYVLKVVDSLGCTNTKTYSIEEPDSLTLVVKNLKNISCFDDADGFINVSAIGGTKPYRFIWNNGQSTPVINQLNRGSYQVSISDSNGCTTTRIFQITEPDSLQVSYREETAPSCGKENGEVNLNITGGVKPYNVVWSNGNLGSDLKDVSEGTYMATITDSGGCFKKIEIELKDGYDKKLYFANSFTPNDDNLNEVYEIKGPMECFTNAHFRVFNRWGERVFETSNPFTEFWDGTISGNAQPKIDTYTFHFSSEEYSKSGYFQIIR